MPMAAPHCEQRAMVAVDEGMIEVESRISTPSISSPSNQGCTIKTTKWKSSDEIMANCDTSDLLITKTWPIYLVTLSS